MDPIEKAQGENLLPLNASEAGDAGPPPPYPPQRPRPRGPLRAIRFLLAGTILYFGLRFIFLDVVKLSNFYHRHKGCGHRQQTILGFRPPTHGFPIPPELSIVSCAEWSAIDAGGIILGKHKNLEAVSAKFTLPVNASKLFLLATGSHSAGNVDIVQTDETGDQVIVDVATHLDHRHRHHDHRRFEWVKVCRVDGPVEGESGIGFFTHEHHRRRRRHRHYHDFKVTVRLPKSASLDKGPLKIRGFETDLPLYAQKIHDLAEGVEFESISLSSSLTPIIVTSIRAQTAEFKTAINRISGNFNVTKSLTLKTVNAPITVNVSLHENTTDKDAAETQLIMQTANGPIDASISLFSHLDAETGQGGRFGVNAETVLAPVSLKFLTAPVDSSLNARAQTTLARAFVHLHETYEGQFRLSTVLAQPQVNYDADHPPKDPAKRGRRRLVEYNINNSAIDGRVFWTDGKDSDGERRGMVDISSSMANVELEL